ncbi:hypothetical protein [Lacticaseibacillus yichunensis]|uniref:ABC-2 family transporter n=1 Tax=Lacticaseibacillus yichunensis TaxID=2486015 RepID=A0ABW4CP10_9LACO|nr:hypothetical protein [Lacticaseibacillus yichunensis]
MLTKAIVEQTWRWFLWHRRWQLWLVLAAALSASLACHGLHASLSGYALQNTVFDRFQFLVVYFPLCLVATLTTDTFRGLDAAACGTRAVLWGQRVLRLLVTQTALLIWWSLFVLGGLLWTHSLRFLDLGLAGRTVLTLWLTQLLVSSCAELLVATLHSRIAAFLITWLAVAGLFALTVAGVPALIFAFATVLTPMRAAGDQLILLGLTGFVVTTLRWATAREAL